MFKISIPKPCHQNWETMIPNDIGRHCNSCVKTVVDFTAMTDEEIKYFFINKKEEKVCGRFKTEQLHRITIELPENIFYTPLPFWKKFLAACLLVFSTTLFSCDTTVKGIPVITIPASTALPINEFNVGKASVPPPPPPVCTTVGDLKVLTVADSVIIGDTDIYVAPPTICEPALVVETPAIDSSNKKTNNDSLKIKNPPVADSNNCSSVIFY
jgi:hypothetical protein